MRQAETDKMETSETAEIHQTDMKDRLNYRSLLQKSPIKETLF